MSKTASKVSFDETRLKKACCGHFRSTGGLNTPDLRNLAYPALRERVKKLQRKDLLLHLCKEYVYSCNPEKQLKLFRDQAKIMKRIEKDPKYEDMRPYMKQIISHWLNNTCCEMCGVILEYGVLNPDRLDYTEYGIRDAIDHIHELEGTGINTFRGRLCMKCNTEEGKAKKKAQGDFDKHVEILSERLEIDPRAVRLYLYDTYHPACDMDVD